MQNPARFRGPARPTYIQRYLPYRPSQYLPLYSRLGASVSGWFRRDFAALRPNPDKAAPEGWDPATGDLGASPVPVSSW